MEATAPAKIYIQPNAHDGWFETNNLNGSLTEYHRTDFFIKDVKRWLAEIHRVCDITDENGYRIDLRELQYRFEQYIKN